ncbi:MAG: ABC transporter substrate-binding protein [Chloroflexota bacterium]|nr:ABC transporter substrate-binding protein [Chloroflexota bacterium]
MNGKLSRRNAVKGAATVASAAALGVASKKSSVFAAPAFVRQTGSAVNVVYWGSWSGELGEAEQEVVTRFNDSQSDVVIEYQFQGSYEETAQKLTAALAANQTPDVSALSDVWWFRFYLANALAPLNDLIAANDVDTSDYVDSLFQEGVRNDVSYWLPFARSTPLFYFNREAFAEAGLPDRGPETWDEFLGWIPDLMVEESGNVTRHAFGHPDAASYVAWLFQPVVWQWGGAYSDPDFTIRLAEAEAVAAGEFYKSSTADGWALPGADHVVDFNNGLTSAIMASTGSIASIAANATFDYGTSFLPEGMEFGCCTGGAGLSVLANAPAEKQDAALQFIAFATSPEITTFWSQVTGYMPVRKSAIESPEMQAFYDENPNFETAVNQLPLTRAQDAARVFIPNGDQIIGSGIERILINQEDVQTVFSEVAAILEEEAQPVLDAIAALG